VVLPVTSTSRRPLNDNADQKVIALLWAWHRFEKRNGGPSVIDFALTPPKGRVNVHSRLDVLRQIEGILSESSDQLTRERLAAHATFLRVLMGQQYNFADYLSLTQGLPVHEFSQDYLDMCQSRLKDALSLLTVAWDRDIKKALMKRDRLIPKHLLVRYFRKRLVASVPVLSEYLGIRLHCPVTFKFVEVDEYWGYWVDGNWRRFRMRFNHVGSGLGESECEQFLHHELLAHCCQLSSWREAITNNSLRVICGTTTVHTPEQFIFEGLAQTMPLFLETSQEGSVLSARIFLSHFTSLVLNNVHVKINSGCTLEDCITYVRKWLPTMSDGTIVSECMSRTLNSLFRSYQYVYGYSFDYFFRLSLVLTRAEQMNLLKKVFTEYLTYADINKEYQISLL